MEQDPRVRVDWFGTRSRCNGWTMIDLSWVAQVLCASIVLAAIVLAVHALKWALS